MQTLDSITHFRVLCGGCGQVRLYYVDSEERILTSTTPHFGRLVCRASEQPLTTVVPLG